MNANASEIFKQSITLEQSQEIQTQKIISAKEKLHDKNLKTIENLKNIINDCRVNPHKYVHQHYIIVDKYNEELEKLLQDLGFKTYRKFIWDHDYYNAYVKDVFICIRDEELRNSINKNKSSCILL